MWIEFSKWIDIANKYILVDEKKGKFAHTDS